MSKEDTRVIPSIVKSLRKNKNITIFNNGKQTRTFCYVTDAIDGFLKTLINGKKGEIYNIGNEKNEISMNDLAKKIKQSFQNQSKL
jgi:Nucleoside-diphosphate-sugar epimerases